MSEYSTFFSRPQSPHRTSFVTKQVILIHMSNPDMSYIRQPIARNIMNKHQVSDLLVGRAEI